VPRKILAVHPGEMLADEMRERSISIPDLARQLGVTPALVRAIVNHRHGLTVDLARRLAQCFATSPEMWMNLQAEYDLRRSKLKL
jgi:addiction module HigA family antidote